MKPHLAITALLLAVSLGWVLFASLSQAHTLPDQGLPNFGVYEKLGTQVPLDLTFTDQGGRMVRLGDYSICGPVILTLNYYSCPPLCPLVFRNRSNTIAAVKGLSLAKDYRIVTLSIDPEETVESVHAIVGDICFVQGTVS